MERQLRDDDIVHLTLVGPTGAQSQMETPIKLADLADYIIARMPQPPKPEESQDTLATP